MKLFIKNIYIDCQYFSLLYVNKYKTKELKS
jgi:hypothetical protein